MTSRLPTTYDPSLTRTSSDPQAPDGRPLKICMLAACPFPANSGTAGSIREMAEAIADLGHEVHIITYHFGEDIPVKGPRVHRITALTGESTVVIGPTTRRPLYDLQMIFKTLQVIREQRPDVLHAHGYEAALVAWPCRLLTRVPVLYSGHNTMDDELPSYNFIRPKRVAVAIARMLDAFVPRTVDRCLPHSASMQRFFQGMGLGARTEPVVPFGIDLDWLASDDGAAVRRRYGLGDGPVLVYAGMLDPLQRPDLLLEATAHVVGQEPRARLLVVVTNSAEQHLKRFRRRAAELGLGDRVVLTETQPLAALPKLLSVGDVAVAPRPRTAGMSVKLLNYMALRRPSVLFASSTTNGLAHRENAMLAAPDTGEALGEAILEVLRDGELRWRLAQNGHRFVREHHDRRQVAQLIYGAYLRTLAAAGRLLPRSREGALGTVSEPAQNSNNRGSKALVLL